MKKPSIASSPWTLAGTLAMIATASALATEGGGSVYPAGVENFTCCALPPPGVYGMVYAEHYTGDTVRGDAGQVVTPPTFKVRATAIVPRILWVSPRQVGGASWAVHAILPIVDLDVNVVPGLAQHKTGPGDIAVGSALGWHHSQSLHSLVAIDVYAPTGRYNKSDLANIGRNYWAVQPLAGVSYIDPAGFNGDAKVMWTFNGKNGDTNYRSGQEFIVDYALGWGFGNGFTAGVGGCVYKQVTHDEQNGMTVLNNKGRALAVGPSIKYESPTHWFVTAKYQVESAVRNRVQGQSFWLKAVFPL